MDIGQESAGHQDGDQQGNGRQEIGAGVAGRVGEDEQGRTSNNEEVDELELQAQSSSCKESRQVATVGCNSDSEGEGEVEHNDGGGDGKNASGEGGQVTTVGCNSDLEGEVEVEHKDGEGDGGNILREGGQVMTVGCNSDLEGEGEVEHKDGNGDGGNVSAEGGGVSSGVTPARRAGVRQEATALMMDKALKLYGNRIIVRDEAKISLKAMVKNFLGGLLCRPELSGSMDSKNVKKAIDHWIPKEGGVGGIMR